MSNFVPIVNLPYLSINDIKITNHATAPDTKLNVGPGLCRDQTNAFDINMGNAGGVYGGIDADTTTVLDVDVNGINGLDTGTLAASTLYHVYAVADFQTANTTGVIASLAVPTIGPLMPAGYNLFRHIGYFVSDSSADILLAYIGGNNNSRVLVFDAPQATAITAGNATTYTDIVLTTLVPAIENTPVIITSAFTPGAASRTLNMQPVNTTGDAVTITGQVTSVIVTTQSLIMARLETGAPKIAYKVANAGDAAAINVAGFYFYI